MTATREAAKHPDDQAMDQAIVEAAIAEAGESGVEVAGVSLDSVARRAGISRATLFRRIGSRRALEEAVRRAGVDPGKKQSVRERALEAAVELMARNGVEALTLEEVARRAGCAVTSVSIQFGGRDGLLSVLFERYSPIATVERVLERRPGPFEEQVRLVYGHFFDAIEQRAAVGQALFASVFGRPDGPVAHFFHRTAVPRIITGLGRWLAEEARNGNCREMAPSLLIPIFLGPLAVHMMARATMEQAGKPVPDREAVVQVLTEAFCHGVGA